MHLHMKIETSQVNLIPLNLCLIFDLTTCLARIIIDWPESAKFGFRNVKYANLLIQKNE